MEEVDCGFCLQEEEIPLCFGKCWVDTGKNYEKVHFEGADGTFSSIPAMHIRWYQLEFALPCVRDGVLVCRTCFVVQYLGGDRNSEIFQALHDHIVCWYAVSVGLRLEWLDQDCVGT